MGFSCLWLSLFNWPYQRKILFAPVAAKPHSQAKPSCSNLINIQAFPDVLIAYLTGEGIDEKKDLVENVKSWYWLLGPAGLGGY